MDFEQMRYGIIGGSDGPAALFSRMQMAPEDIVALLILFLMFALTVAILCLLWRMLKIQRRTLRVMEATNKISAEMLETLQDIQLASARDDGYPGDEEDEEEKAGDETPADFVYCPECSTRVEVDPAVRDVNVICPDCKKPFHIH